MSTNDSVVYPFQMLGSQATEKLNSDASPTVFGGNISPKSLWYPSICASINIATKKSPSPPLPADGSKEDDKPLQRRESQDEKQRRSRSHSKERKRSRSRSPRRSRSRSPRRRNRSPDRRRRSKSRERRRSRSTSRDRRRSRSTSRERKRRSRSNERKHRRRRSRSPRRRSPRRSRSPRRRRSPPRRRRSRSPFCSKWAKKSDGLTRAVLPADGKPRGSKQVSTEEVEARLAVHMKNVKEKAAEEAKKINLPGYLNPAMVNVHQFKQVREKRKLLWSKAAEKKTGAAWSGAFDDKNNDEKFRRLMGINETNADGEGTSKIQESRKVLDELEKEYEKSRIFQLSRGAGGVTGIGLGFGGGTGVQ